ncbi:MAG: hypothetical protein N2588_07015 [Rhodovarius sp.]|nr:hypothetical protein [Rhodovarius sp.]
MSLAEALDILPPGGLFMQWGGAALPALRLAPAALAAGARRAWHVEALPPAHPAWEELCTACGPNRDRLVLLPGAPTDQAELPVVDVLALMQLFHEADPLLWLHLAAPRAQRRLLLGTVLIPAAEAGLAPDALIPGTDVQDPRLSGIRRVLEGRGIRLPQFDSPPAGRDSAGRPLWEGMWHWFMTEGALTALVESQGFRIVALRPVWLDLGVLAICDRA